MFLSIPIRPLILVGGSGSGRSAIIFHLTMNLPHKFQRVISHTTRRPRPNQKDGISFFFTNEQQIKSMNSKQQLFTLLKSPNDHYYGLARTEVETVMKKGRIPIFKMTLNAYLKNRDKMKMQHDINCQALFISVPDMSKLKRRLEHSPFTKEQIQSKMIVAEAEEKEANKYFPEENIIKNQSMDETIVYLRSRLFQLF